MTAQTKDWLYGLLSAFIGGGAAAVSGGIGGIALAPDKFNLGPGFVLTLKLMPISFMLPAITHVFAYLAKRPLPEWTTKSEAITKSTIVEPSGVVVQHEVLDTVKVKDPDVKP